MSELDPPIGLLAELTHRCPLQCPYCSNPLNLESVKDELSGSEWKSVFDQAARLGVLQLHLSGGEPTVRRDLEDLIAHARSAGLYTNLITAGVLLDKARMANFAEAGLDHVQLSLQGADPASANRVGHYKNGHAKKLEAARLVQECGLPLTINAVVHRQNIDQLDEIIELALTFGAHRLEVAHVQYYGWALINRAALIPTIDQLSRATTIVNSARQSLSGRMAIDYVVPDYYAQYPKPCMGGWGQSVLTMSPSGDVLPCHAAKTISGLEFDNVRKRDLKWIWHNSPAFQRFRGTKWMPELCRSCERRDIDFGGCRCQAMALTGDAANTDPACAKSPLHDQIFKLASDEAAAPAPEFVYRRPGAHLESI